MKSIILSAVLVAIATAGAPIAAQAAPQKAAAAKAPVVQANDALTRMFVWWNAAYKDKNGFTKAAFEKYFTPDAVMRINGRDSAVGSQDLADHFQQIQARTEAVEIELPFLETFQSPDHKRIFTYHVVTARAEGKDSRELVMGYADIRNGRIALINFVSAPPAPPKAAK
jgi:hypothetical protein